MAESLSQQKKNMSAFMKRMTKKYGVVKLGNSRADIEQCIYLILREGWDFRKANKAILQLQESFVDWNELRVSGNREILECLSFLTYDNLEEKIVRIKEFLGEVYAEYNRLRIDFIEELEFEETRKVFASFEFLGQGNAYIFLQCLQDRIDEVESDQSATLVMSTEALRVGIRLGLIKKTSSHNVGRKEYCKLIGSKDFIPFQNLFVRHGEVYCTSKSPLCSDCFLSKDCAYTKQ